MSYIFKMTCVNNLEKKKALIAYEAAAAHNIIVLFQHFSFLHYFFPYGSLSLLCNKLSACFDRLERSRDGVGVTEKRQNDFERNDFLTKD